MSTLFRNKTDGWRKLADIIARRDSFHNSTKSFRGTAWIPSYGWRDTLSRLPQEWVDRFRADLIGDGIHPTMDYIVYSYQTPIAWHTPGTGWTVPDVTYSPTTSGHQRIIRTAVRHLSDYRTVSATPAVEVA